MGKRGPQPIDIPHLKDAAKGWATLLFGLRDGARGIAEKWGQTLFVGIATPKARRKTEALLKDLERQGYQIGWPVYPSPVIWKRLKKAASKEQAVRALLALQLWKRRELPHLGSDDLLRQLQSDPSIFVRAKRLPHYPKRSQSNDDKRIIFVARILAGLQLGLAPLTATKRLSNWRCENYWSTVSTPYVDSFKKDRAALVSAKRGRKT
jgi:hypothetical protein